MMRRSLAAGGLGLLLLSAAYACSDSAAPASSRTLTVSRAPASAAENGADHEFLPGERGYRKHEQHNRSFGGKTRLVRCEKRPAAEASGEIGPSGGELIVGRARLIVPPGALSRTVHLSATEPEGEIAFVSFEPQGLLFKKPAGLIFDATDCDIDDDYVPDVVYLDDEGNVLERIRARYSSYWHTVAAPIDHFSGYALAW